MLLYLKRLYIVLLLFPIDITAQTLATVNSVDLNQYAGKWYEIASFPQRFQKGCHCTTAEYTLTDKNYVVVKNSCRLDSITGKAITIQGKAFVKKKSGNAKLKVQFFWPFRGDYWIIDLADNYSYAVVGHPNRKYLWILSRTNTMSDSLYNKITERLVLKDFDVTKLVRTRHHY